MRALAGIEALCVAAPLLDVRAVSKSYDGRQVIERVRFSVEAGEIVSLVAPSGCGKSTVQLRSV